MMEAVFQRIVQHCCSDVEERLTVALLQRICCFLFMR